MDVICLIATPRAGTERLSEVLGNFGDLALLPGLSDSLDAHKAGAPGRRVLAVPLFDGNIHADEVIDRPDTRFILVVRKQIDCYVDLLCADGRPRLDAVALADWLSAQERWYDSWRNALNRRGLPCPVLRYESDIDQPAAQVLKRFSAAAAQLGIVLKPPVTLAEPAPLVRPAPMSERVGNWTEFSRDIFARGLERRAYGYPL